MAPATSPQVFPRKVYPTYFSDRDSWYIDEGEQGAPWPPHLPCPAPTAAATSGCAAAVCMLFLVSILLAPVRGLHDLSIGAGITDICLVFVGPASCCNSVSAALSRKIWAGLFNISMIDEDGNVLEDPRWVLSAVCPCTSVCSTPDVRCCCCCELTSVLLLREGPLVPLIDPFTAWCFPLQLHYAPLAQAAAGGCACTAWRKDGGGGGGHARACVPRDFA